jgi:hypothetical protein
MLTIQKCSLACVLIGAAVLAGCGSSSNSSSNSSSGSPSSTAASGGQATTAGSSGPGALSADARSAATGDIPDNQVFLVFHDTAAGYSMKYPEGWSQSGAGREVTIRDKNNLVHVLIASGGAPTPASVAAQLRTLERSQPTLRFRAPRVIQIGSSSAVKVIYTTQSPPNPVTGRRVKLIVDRYVLAHGGRVATVDLGTPTGVDNVDAYRLMIESFRWS